MLSSLKKTTITLFFLTVIAFVGIWFYSLNRTYFNKEDELGNTSGNIYNGGLFCEQEGKIYFSNAKDDGSLYVMNSDCSNIKKLHDDKTVFINVDENYIYYLRANNTRDNNSGSILMFNNSGIYRVDRNGNNIKSITSNPGSYLSLMGNFLYFQRYDVGVGLYLYRYQIDGKKERLLVEDAVVPAAVIDNSLYYTGFSYDQNINRVDLSSFTTGTIYEGNFAYPIFRGDYIYYMDIAGGYTINRMKPDGSEKTVLVQERCSTFNITNSGKYLYYQVDNQENNRMSRLDLTTLEAETILEGNYKQIHVTENYVFFKDFNETETYIQAADGSLRLGTFNPPDLD